MIFLLLCFDMMFWIYFWSYFGTVLIQWRAYHNFHWDQEFLCWTCWCVAWSTRVAWRHTTIPTWSKLREGETERVFLFLIVLMLLANVIQVTLAGFRAGKFLVLVATNVAARGLDINDVQLIIQVCIYFLLIWTCSGYKMESKVLLYLFN